MSNLAIVLAATGAITVAGCTTQQGAVGGALAGAAIGGFGTNSVAGAVVGAGVGAFAGAIIVRRHNNGWCTYRHHGQLYNAHC